MRESATPCYFPKKISSKKILKASKFIMMVLLFTVYFQNISNAQSCNGMTTSGTISNTGDVITYKASVNFEGEEQIINWTIEPNTSGAYFTLNKKNSLQQTAKNGENSISINVGKKAGAFTVTLTFDEASPADVGSCSASRIVNKAPVQ